MNIVAKTVSTFWNDLRAHWGYSISDIASLIDMDVHTTKEYLTGRAVPEDSTIAIFCRFFDVDFETGKSAFINAYAHWVEEHPSAAPQPVEIHTEDISHTEQEDTNMAKITKTTKTGKYSKSNTFWRKLRVESGVSFSELAKYMGCSSSILKTYFSGSVLPSDEQIQKICEYFKVDYNQGKAAFIADFNAWGEAHADTHTLRGRCYIANARLSSRKRTKTRRKANAKKAAAKAPAKAPVEPTTFDCLELLYGKIPYADFKAIVLCTSTEDLLQNIYGKVSFETYRQIVQTISG